MTDTNPQKQSKTASTELKDDGAFFTHFHKLIPIY